MPASARCSVRHYRLQPDVLSAQQQKPRSCGVFVGWRSFSDCQSWWISQRSRASVTARRTRGGRSWRTSPAIRIDGSQAGALMAYIAIRSKSYRTPSPRVVLPLVPCIWSHQRCGKHRRCRDRSALGRPLCQGYAGKDVGQARLSWAMSVISYSNCRTVRLALARQVDAQRGGARPFSKGFASAALQGFVPTPVRDTWRGSVAASRAISVPRRRSASGAMRQLPPTQPRRGGM